MADDAAIKTYRYLRIGMVGAVFALLVSIGIERADVGCWQTSISAYYYTPVRAVFVGSLMAIGLSLIVIEGSTVWEDAFLNLAGMLAPVVAIVPTTTVGTCRSVEPASRPTENGAMATWVVENVDNNIKTLLIAGIAGLVIAAIIATIAARDLRAIARVGEFGTRLGLLGTMVFLVAGSLAFRYWDGFYEHAHLVAAFGMFGALAFAIASNAWQRRGSSTGRWYFWIYAGTALLMVASVAVMYPLDSRWTHMVLLLEATEIGLFAAFWLVQTKEHWNETV